ncbi:MAG: BlaI/MecI/CopY family transcriptional regulator [Deltaproteobacteria bacterium]|nr:BlaI/MecI/CopY family transcriptional regulator [Deltaproteobacteria bacterium]
MDVVWSRGLERFTVGDVLRVLERRRDVAYTTVMTMLGRLHEKGLLDRHKDGKRYVYSARMTREEFMQDTAREVLEGLEKVSSPHAVALLAERVSSAGSDELEELEAAIRKRREELGE